MVYDVDISIARLLDWHLSVSFTSRALLYCFNDVW